MVIGFAVFTLAVLNPLLCLVHCAQAHHRLTHLTPEQQAFLCDLGPDQQSGLSAPFEKVWSGPRAVYEALLFAPVSLMVLAVRLTFIAMALTDPPQYLAAPEFPPPKAPALLNAH
jgi:hypothetical protein